MADITAITGDNFEEQIQNKDGVTVIRFWATWCGPCTRMKPIYNEIAQDLGEKANFTEVDIDVAPEVAGAFGIRSVPTVVIMKDGQPVDGLVGLAPKSQYVGKIEAQL